MNPAAFQAYGIRSWNNVIYVSQSVFDSYTTADSLSSLAAVQAFVSTIRTSVGTPATPPAVVQPPTRETSVDTSQLIALRDSAIQDINAAKASATAEINTAKESAIREIESTEGSTRVIRTTSSVDNRQIERIYERINDGDKRTVDNVINTATATRGTPPQTSVVVTWSAVQGNSVSYQVRIAEFEWRRTDLQWNTENTNNTTYTFTDLQADFQYIVEVRAVVNGKHGEWKQARGNGIKQSLGSGYPEVKTIGTAERESTVNLDRVENLATGTTTDTSIALSWDAVTPKGIIQADDIEYQIAYYPTNHTSYASWATKTVTTDSTSSCLLYTSPSPRD